MAQKDFTVTGKRHQVDNVSKDLKKKHHIKGERLDHDKLQISTKDEAEVHAVIEAADRHGAKIKK